MTATLKVVAAPLSELPIACWCSERFPIFRDHLNMLTHIIPLFAHTCRPAAHLTATIFDCPMDTPSSPKTGYDPTVCPLFRGKISVMHEARSRPPLRQRHPQRCERERTREPLLERPSDDATRKPIQQHGQITPGPAVSYHQTRDGRDVRSRGA